MSALATRPTTSSRVLAHPLLLVVLAVVLALLVGAATFLLRSPAEAEGVQGTGDPAPLPTVQSSDVRSTDCGTLMAPLPC